jgi:predicted Fe-S protein YdhL (DUF1289 family)
MDEDKVCIGCYRSSEEIAAWDGFTEDQKQKVIENTIRRRTEKGGTFYGFG